MNRFEAKWGEEMGENFYKTSDSAVKMIVERLNLERIGLPLQTLPLCTEAESIRIEEIIPRAKEGFALSLKSGASTKSQDIDILDITTPFTVEQIWSTVRLADRQNTLPEFGHVTASLMLLSQAGRASFFQFPEPPENIDYQTGMTETYWANSTDTFESIWTHMEELENLVRTALYSDRPMKRQDMLKVGHFFMTGKVLARIFRSL